jgi:dipeptidyl aminopeptidase/acylaminoacyl peptidase
MRRIPFTAPLTAAGRLAGLLALLGALTPLPGAAQGTRADYLQADSFAARARRLVSGVAETPTWIAESSRFWYRKSVQGGDRFVLVDATAGNRSEPFDHERLAAALTEARGDTVTAVTLPFQRFEFEDEGRAIEFSVADSTWRCALADYRCERRGPASRQAGDRDRWYPWQAGPGQRWRIPAQEPVRSPDGTLEALIVNYNVAVRAVGERGHRLLSQDGVEGDRYTHASLVWSPDSRMLAAYRVVPGYERQIHYVRSSPEDQIQPRHSTLIYAKPGDVLDRERPVVFHVAEGRAVEVDDALFPNAYSLSPVVWRKEAGRFTFEYNQRGHQVYRVVEVDGATGAARAVVSEEPRTFFDYSGKRFRFDVDDGREIVWMSERDGWNHLWLLDGATGRVKNQITKGEWVVRGVDTVDVANRRIWFRASGVEAGKDPYFVHLFSVGFDGKGLTRYTEEDGNHEVSLSPDLRFYVDRWSRVDQPPVALLRRTSDRSVVMELERADASALLATGWRPPEVFVAKGRDGVTDIWGIITVPTDFDPTRRYPVIESIYAGPHSSFVPKAFSTNAARQSLAELGFVVVQIDGMGTSNRSKAFHDVAWKNIKDAGFPDRILWHRAVAARYRWYDISNVGIFGTSAGGQNAMGALLFHPDFYKVAVSAAGCHDNRMDKIWWNELWMSWPLGPHYAASSNVENAHLLQGRLLVIVPELDTNVDPSSTLQVVDALIEADKDFDFAMVPGADHGIGGDWGTRKRNDFFVRHILGVDPPDWNRVERSVAGGGSR